MSETMLELTNTMQQLLQLADSDDPDDQEIFTDSLEAIKGEIGVKADAYVYVIQKLKAQAESCQSMADYLKNKASRIDKNIDRMKTVILAAVELAGGEIDGKSYKFKAAKNGGKQAIEITGDVPPEFMKANIEYVNDTDAIRDALDHGHELSFARYKPRGKHLSIK